MRITINLASRPYANLGPALKRLRIAMAALVVLCLLFFLGLHLFDRQARDARAREHSLDGQIARVQAERAAAEAMMHHPNNAQVLVQAEALNQLFDEKAFSWTLAMEAMETVLPAGVQVTSIEPIRAPDGHITVHVRVVGPRDKADDLVANLEHSRRFLLPRITGENAESSNNPSQRQEPISISNRFDFELLADYNPPNLEEERIAARPAHHAPPAIPLGIENPAHSHHPPDSPQGRGRPPYTGPNQGGPQ
ncbi:MAG: fimbrial assembly protein [Terracidiphilus sp.]